MATEHIMYEYKGIYYTESSACTALCKYSANAVPLHRNNALSGIWSLEVLQKSLDMHYANAGVDQHSYMCVNMHHY